MGEPVVVTGMGAVTPLGIGIDALWSGVVNGRSAVGPITRFDASGLGTRIAAEVKGFDAEACFGRREARRMEPFVQYAVHAARQAVADAGLQNGALPRTHTGVIIGTGIGGVGILIEQSRILETQGPRRVSPLLIPMMLPDMAAGQVAIDLGIEGPNMAVISACASGANAIGEAAAMIRRGAAEVMIAGGTEAAILPIAIAGFNVMGALSTNNDAGPGANRPFDARRDGFVMGEGAGIVVLESLSHARGRGAHIYGEVAGYGASADASHITAPREDGAGAIAAMQRALLEAGLSPEDIDYVNAHGTGTLLNDAIETTAIKKVFGAAAEKLPVSSTKPVTGHLLGAAGAVEAIICLLAMRAGAIPPTINYAEPDPACDLDYVPNQARPARLRTTMSNSFGFGGHNACLVFRTVTGEAG
ncbi:MAG: beta-ketoacyl-ACP synthase II [Anaerolineae bacterium]|nr:beta-ketoacyl-ACP synthase II [Anaerolineae bacterium]